MNTRDLLKDDQWQRIAHLLPGKATDSGRTALNNRLFVEAVLWIARCGAPWRDLPAYFGPWNSVFKRFSRWSEKHVWERVFGELAKDSDFEEVFLDGTIVRAHQHAAGAPKNKGEQALGRSRGGLSTKIHALVEGLGNLARVVLTGGQVHDSTIAVELLQQVVDEEVESVAADKAYDTDAILNYVASRGAKAVIPPRSNRKDQRPVDWHQYKSRNLIERFFCRIKQFRGIATRYAKLAGRFLSFISLAAAYIWLA